MSDEEREITRVSFYADSVKRSGESDSCSIISKHKVKEKQGEVLYFHPKD